MKKFLRRIYILISRGFFSLVYDSKYLKGRWFQEPTGWIWCWRCWWDQKVKGYNKKIPFPVNPTTTIGNINNISFDLSNIDNFWKNGCYYQCWNGKIKIGKGTWIAQNVGIITENHNPYDLSCHLNPEDVIIGEDCWIGMNAIIMPGVQLGNRTIVGAGAVVTHSFKDGNCIIAGSPAKKVKDL